MKQGFTLVELLITLGLIAILGTFTFISFSGYRQRQLLDETARAIVVALRDAQQRAINQQDGSDWGVHFENSVSGRDFYAVFKGSTYVSPVTISYLSPALEFLEPANGSKDVVFDKLSGVTSPTSITIGLLDNPSSAKTITINGVGQVQY